MISSEDEDEDEGEGEEEEEFGMLDQCKDQQWDVGRYEI